jgi:adenylosuccinate synthase
MEALAVIGAGFGDEGKGRMVDAFASARPGAIVVRYNGGAQAAHTVLTPEGRRHAFSHIGAGTFAGAATYLSRFFVVNPVLWAVENEKMESRKIYPELFLNPDAIVSVPHDMILNREAEIARGENRHGSCGYGINEAVERFLAGGFRIRVADLAGDISGILQKIGEEYVPARLKALGIRKPAHDPTKVDGLVDMFHGGVKKLRIASKLMKDEDLRNRPFVIFEGAQGLLLDENHRFFPHVTRSRTGLPNIADICRRCGITEIEVVYTTRAYATRHGNGPFPTEDKSLSYEDPTNTKNDWQGDLRFGYLDLDLISEAVKDDLARAGSLKVKVSVAVTCLDQVGPTVKYKYRDSVRTCETPNFPGFLARTLKATRAYASLTPHRIQPVTEEP